MREIPERDWKYLRGVKGELLEALCHRINDGARHIVADQASGQHERFLRLYGYIMEQNEVVADCFDDWRRSNILDKLLALCRHRLLADEHIPRLSAETRDRISRWTSAAGELPPNDA
jgi:hypothetical protein